MNFFESIHPTLTDIDAKVFSIFQTSPPEFGQRHTALFYIATYFLGHELPTNLVTSILEMWNGTKIKEPLPLEQIRYIVHAAQKTRKSLRESFS